MDEGAELVYGGVELVYEGVELVYGGAELVHVVTGWLRRSGVYIQWIGVYGL